ncbi:MAG: HlyD family efflux transporter periplasmic adaptor subunit [Nitrospiraceae bacterium]|nr:HlyD family efflux transporter periplasmic adaptor subunit [Nitrospiraceae bacterium]
MATTTEPTSQQITTLIHLAALTHLEGQIRAAKTVQELQFLCVNETRRLIPYEQAFLLSSPDPGTEPFHVVSASSVALVDRDAPMILWLEAMGRALLKNQNADEPMMVTEDLAPEELREGWHEFVKGHVFWCPLKHPDETVLGTWWFERDTPWQENDVTIVHRLAGSYAYAWKALSKKTRHWSMTIKKPSVWLIAAAIVAALCIPVRMSALAPVKVMAKDPVVVSAPMDGVIADVFIPPNQTVKEGLPLFRYEDINLRNQFRVAEKQLAIAQAEYQQAVQAGFVDPQRKADAPLKEAEADLRQTELDYAKEMLGQVDVTALKQGVLLYSDKSDWIGRPVTVGERIMEIADPKRIELRIELPVADAIVLKEGAEVMAFLNALPLESFTAAVTHASYHADVLPGDILAYRVTAELAQADPRIRIGWQGTAKLYGEWAPLAYLLLRHPFIALRQRIGY